MTIDIDQARLRLSNGNHLKLIGARRTTLTVISGTAWITVDGQAGDELISQGESFVVASDRPVLVGPLSSPLTLDMRRVPAAMHRPTLAHRLRVLCGSVMRRLAAAAGSPATAASSLLCRQPRLR